MAYPRVLFVQAPEGCVVRIRNWERYGLKSQIEAAKRRLHHNVLAIARVNTTSGRRASSRNCDRFHVEDLQHASAGMPALPDIVIASDVATGVTARGTASALHRLRRSRPARRHWLVALSLPLCFRGGRSTTPEGDPPTLEQSTSRLQPPHQW